MGVYVYNQIQFDYAPWGRITGLQQVLDGYETGLFQLDGTPLPYQGAQYGYSITQQNVTPSFAVPAPPPPIPPPLVVPQSVDALQFRLALTQAGLRAAVENYIASASQDIKDYYQFSPTVDRNHPLIESGLSALGKTDADADQLFVLAGSINA